ncbi:MAG: hypothetical protein ACYSUK_02985 [Planctomycetota bacterium]|jgi:hypothetical protein
MKNSIDEIKRPTALVRYGRWWPVLLGPLTMVLVYIARLLDIQWIVSRTPNENIALVLVGISLVGFTVQAFLFRSEFHLFMASLCAAFFCREWHFPGTSKGIYIALGVLAVWAVMRRKKLESYIKNSMVKIWIPCMIATYFLSQLIARRAFRGILPIEDEVNVALEESIETVAHIMMIVICLIALKARGGKVKKTNNN